MVKRYPSNLPPQRDRVLWTDSQDRIAIRAFNAGIPVIDMAELFEDRRYKGIEARLHMLRVAGKVGTRVRRYTAEQVTTIIALRRRGITASEIAEQIDRSVTAARDKLKLLRRAGLCPYIWTREMFAGFCKRSGADHRPISDMTDFRRKKERRAP